MKRFLNSIKEFFTEVQAELKKVSYPSKSETMGSTSVVILFVVIVSLFLALVDNLLVRLVSIVIQ
ncbi:MAG: preprotein translocase subunit SecE [Nitrospirota bacterium]|nr:preprotein translocase subunit SecE [Nitrospirota bacterium]